MYVEHSGKINISSFQKVNSKKEGKTNMESTRTLSPKCEVKSLSWYSWYLDVEWTEVSFNMIN